MITKRDTSIVKLTDSSTIVQTSREHIILIQDLKKEPEKLWYENELLTSFVIPILVAFFVTWITNFLNRKKNKLEIDKLKGETSNLRKSFQPVVVGTIQAVNDKLIDTKVAALKKLTFIKSKFIDVPQRFPEGEPELEYDDFLEQIFLNFSHDELDLIKKFKDEYSYFLSKKSFEKFNELYHGLDNLYQSRLSFSSVDDGDTEANMNSEIKSILSLFEEVLIEIRSDLHLDNTFIDDFIKSNQISSEDPLI